MRACRWEWSVLTGLNRRDARPQPLKKDDHAVDELWYSGIRRPGPYGGFLGSRYDPLFSVCVPTFDREPKVNYYDPVIPMGAPQLGARHEPTIKDVQLVRIRIGEIPCEWVLAPGADADVRLLDLHGGGRVSGSGGNYLPLAAEISATSRCAVLLPDYRRAPEHPFAAGLEDCIAAHDWLIGNGPSGPGQVKATLIAGNSAGGSDPDAAGVRVTVPPRRCAFRQSSRAPRRQP